MPRDALTGKMISANQEAILVENIVPYARKLGYLISNIRFLLVFFMMLFLVTSVSAFEFDNSKSYDPLNREVTVTNAFGLGDDIAKIRLDTPLVNYVIRGDNRLVAQFTVNSLQEYEEVFNKMEFFDLNSGSKKISRDFTYKYRVLEGYNSVPVYNQECKECKQELVTTIQEPIYSWHSFDYTKGLKTEEIVIGVFTDVYDNDYVDWVPTLYGVEVDEWAAWTEGMKTGLEAHYPFDNATEVIFRELDLWTGGGTPDYISTDCVIGGCVNLTQGDWLRSKESHSYFMGRPNSTRCFWIDKHALANEFVFKTPDGSSPENSLIIPAADTDSFELWSGTGPSGGTFSGAIALEVNNWKFDCIVTNDTSYALYVNGTYTSVLTANTVNDTVNMTIGYHTSKKLDAVLDEMSFWNRTLTAQEISDLYNSGSGLDYFESACSANMTNTTWTDWANYSTCLTDDKQQQNRSKIEYDSNNCGFSNVTWWDWQNISCNYCSYSVVNSSWSAWQNYSTCSEGNQSQNRSRIEYDENYATCYLVTLNSTDLWNSGNNNTHWDWQNISCSGCSNSIVNTTWTDWVNSTCTTLDNRTQNRSLIEYDENNCGNFTNVTHWDSQEAHCNYCSFSVINETTQDWFNVGNCTNSSQTQNRTLNEYDENYATCYLVTSNVTDLWNSGNNNTHNQQQSINCGDSTAFEIDFNNFTAMIFLILFVIAGFMFYLQLYVFSGGLVGLLGFVLLFSSFNPIISFVVIAGGVMILFLGK